MEYIKPTVIAEIGCNHKGDMEIASLNRMNVAFIPVRGGSKSIPLKNIKEIAGRPLVYWTVKAANDCSFIDKVYVATDSAVIKDVVEKFELEKVEVIGRSADTATDTASTESAMLEFASHHDFETIALVQATSPLLTSQDLNKGFELYNMEETDSVLSVVRQKRFQWETDEKGFAASANYDYKNRPRRQDFEGYLVENGAFYITGRQALLKTQNRLSGNIRVCEMDEYTYFEIDEPSDWEITEKRLYDRIRAAQSNAVIPQIKMFLTDCDGCLTDGGMYYSENGDELKKFNTKDGMGFKLLREKGIITGIITGEDRELNQNRAEKLHVDEIFQNAKDKVAVIKLLCDKYDILPKQVAYVGDDVNDVEAIKYVGYGCCVKDAHSVVKECADYVSTCNGGQGAVREIIDTILK